MGTKKKKHPGTKGPHGPHAPYRGDYMPVKVEDKWVANIWKNDPKKNV